MAQRRVIGKPWSADNQPGMVNCECKWCAKPLRRKKGSASANAICDECRKESKKIMDRNYYADVTGPKLREARRVAREAKT